MVHVNQPHRLLLGRHIIMAPGENCKREKQNETKKSTDVHLLAGGREMLIPKDAGLPVENTSLRDCRRGFSIFSNHSSTANHRGFSFT
jgi:hypothetical protein